ncbi:hypothetical protein [Roseateles sp.]|uniref:hypothetical protein n=1 Tax=Roseateles sp. TaxID=1971397 RepID=UPI002E0C0AF8|nr:hypothetical protein [Roseateles sp.]
MLMQTTIKPRRDGNVVVQGLDRKTYTFLPDEDGALTCEIVHEATIRHLLALKTFVPATPEEADQAIALLQLDAQDDDGAAGDDDLDDDFDSNALPVESNTTPVAPPKARARSRK